MASKTIVSRERGNGQEVNMLPRHGESSSKSLFFSAVWRRFSSKRVHLRRRYNLVGIRNLSTGVAGCVFRALPITIPRFRRSRFRDRRSRPESDSIKVRNPKKTSKKTTTTTYSGAVR
jgi:hypothetical protein